jgi:predicted nucleic acid-binding protein
MAYVLDTNILLRLFDNQSPVHAAVISAVNSLKASGEILCFAPQNAAELWNVATRPTDKNGLGLSTDDVEPLILEIERLFELRPDTPIMYHFWRALVRECNVAGMQVHDARLVAWMQVHRISHVLTMNTGDFVRYRNATGIVVVDPRDMEIARR